MKHFSTNENWKVNYSAESTAYPNHHLTTYARAMDGIEKKKVYFDVESIVHGHLRNYFVQLFPRRDCSYATGKTGRCHHVLACETFISIRNANIKYLIPLHSEREADHYWIKVQVTKNPDVWISIPFNTPQRN